MAIAHWASRSRRSLGRKAPRPWSIASIALDAIAATVLTHLSGGRGNRRGYPQETRAASIHVRPFLLALFLVAAIAVPVSWTAGQTGKISLANEDYVALRNEDHIAQLNKGAAAWNAWRDAFPSI